MLKVIQVIFCLLVLFSVSNGTEIIKVNKNSRALIQETVDFQLIYLGTCDQFYSIPKISISSRVDNCLPINTAAPYADTADLNAHVLCTNIGPNRAQIDFVEIFQTFGTPLTTGFVISFATNAPYQAFGNNDIGYFRRPSCQIDQDLCSTLDYIKSCEENRVRLQNGFVVSKDLVYIVPNVNGTYATCTVAENSCCSYLRPGFCPRVGVDSFFRIKYKNENKKPNKPHHDDEDRHHKKPHKKPHHNRPQHKQDKNEEEDVQNKKTDNKKVAEKETQKTQLGKTVEENKEEKKTNTRKHEENKPKKHKQSHHKNKKPHHDVNEEEEPKKHKQSHHKNKKPHKGSHHNSQDAVDVRPVTVPLMALKKPETINVSPAVEQEPLMDEPVSNGVSFRLKGKKPAFFNTVAPVEVPEMKPLIPLRMVKQLPLIPLRIVDTHAKSSKKSEEEEEEEEEEEKRIHKQAKPVAKASSHKLHDEDYEDDFKK